MADTMIKCAKSDLFALKTGLSAITSSDEELLNTFFYLMQQVVEKSLKAVVERAGMDPRAAGHSISKLYRSVKNHTPTALSPESDAFLEMSDIELTSYEIYGRYPCDTLFSYKRALELLPRVEKVYEDCAIYLEKINSSKSSALRQMKLFLL